MTLRQAITLIRRVRIVSSFRIGPAIDQRSLSGITFLFDLDGTLIDSVYQHVLA